MQHEISLHTVALHRETEGLVISLREFGFFDSGSAALKPSALPALDRIASILAVRTCRLRIEGHTDNVPIHTAQMASNWELSTARSTELVRLLILRYRFSPDRLSAAGYAEYHPIASNDTPQGRAQNRRVDIVILSEHVVTSSVPDATVEASAAIPDITLVHLLPASRVPLKSRSHSADELLSHLSETARRSSRAHDVSQAALQANLVPCDSVHPPPS